MPAVQKDLVKILGFLKKDKEDYLTYNSQYILRIIFLQKLTCIWELNCYYVCLFKTMKSITKWFLKILGKILSF